MPGTIGSGTLGSGTLGVIGVGITPDIERGHGPVSSPRRSAIFYFQSSFPGVVFQGNLDGEGWIPIVSPYTIADLDLGHHKFAVRAYSPTYGSFSPIMEWEWVVESPRLADMLAQLPPFIRRDPTVRAINEVSANEVDRIEEAMDQLIANFYPQTADIFLSFWEGLFKLPVNPTSKTVEQRRQTVIAFLRRMGEGGTGLAWVSRVIDLVGTSWTYVVHTPGGLRGLLWDRFREISAGWEFQLAPSSIIGIADPTGWLVKTQENGRVVRTDLAPVANGEIAVQFSKDEDLSTALLAMLPKIIDSNNRLRVSWANGAMEVGVVLAGAYTGLGSIAAPLANDKLYWLRGYIEGNKLVGEIWESDPTKNNGDEPLFIKSATLTGEAATKLGSGVVGRQGFSWVNLGNPQWLLRQARINQVGLSVPANTLRVTIPFEQDTYRALEVGILLRSITPANTEIEIFTESGFVLGDSRLGVQGL